MMPRGRMTLFDAFNLADPVRWAVAQRIVTMFANELAKRRLDLVVQEKPEVGRQHPTMREVHDAGYGAASAREITRRWISLVPSNRV